MAENSWLIPFIPAVSYFVILFFGKRMPMKGAESGLLAVGASFVLALLVGAQWISDEEVVHKHWEWFDFGGKHP
ncbi:MAG: hypothetical protein ACRD0O_07020, partial [Acidimicrobiia bacterium]